MKQPQKRVTESFRVSNIFLELLFQVLQEQRGWNGKKKLWTLLSAGIGKNLFHELSTHYGAHSGAANPLLNDLQSISRSPTEHYSEQILGCSWYQKNKGPMDDWERLEAYSWLKVIIHHENWELKWVDNQIRPSEQPSSLAKHSDTLNFCTRWVASNYCPYLCDIFHGMHIFW